MASTNKTTNYELSQFIGSDKPAWLSDYNQDMGKIDAQMKLNADAATSASGTATSASTAIGDISNLTTTDKTNAVAAINEVKTTADTAQSTANSANTTASGCRTDLNKFNLSNKAFLTPTSNLGVVDSTLTVMQFATDTTSSIYKLYGRVFISSLTGITGTLSIKLGNTSLRPASAYEINTGVYIIVKDTNNNLIAVGSRNIKIDTDGSAYIVGDAQNPNYAFTLSGGISSLDFFLSPCLYFNSDFGDI